LHLWEDRDGHTCSLHYVRDKEGHEVDFVIVKNGEVVELVEAKVGDADVSRSLGYFAERLRPPRATQIVLGLDRPYDRGRVRVLGPTEALGSLEP
jgi:hypothetical protein